MLVKDIEFKEEKYPRRLILFPSSRSIDGGATYFRDFKIEQEFRGRYNTWWSNFYTAHSHKEGVFFSKELQQQMFQQKLWQKNGAQPTRNEFGQIIAWGSGVWRLDRNGSPKELPKYFRKSSYFPNILENQETFKSIPSLNTLYRELRSHSKLELIDLSFKQMDRSQRFPWETKHRKVRKKTAEWVNRKIRSQNEGAKSLWRAFKWKTRWRTKRRSDA